MANKLVTKRRQSTRMSHVASGHIRTSIPVLMASILLSGSVAWWGGRQSSIADDNGIRTKHLTILDDTGSAVAELRSMGYAGSVELRLGRDVDGAPKLYMIVDNSGASVNLSIGSDRGVSLHVVSNEAAERLGRDFASVRPESRPTISVADLNITNGSQDISVGLGLDHRSWVTVTQADGPSARLGMFEAGNETRLDLLQIDGTRTTISGGTGGKRLVVVAPDGHLIASWP